MTVELKRRFLEDEIAAYSEETKQKIDDAFMYWFYSLLFGVDFDEIPLEEVVDGAGERQIDLFKIDIDDSQQKAVITLVQTKNTAGFHANVVSLMKAGLDFIFKAKRDVYTKIPNSNLVEQISETRDCIREYGNNSIEVKCLFVTMGDESKIPDEAYQNRDNIFSEYRDSGIFGKFEYEFLGVNALDKLLNLTRNKKRRINHDLRIEYDANRPSIVEFEAAGVRSVLCTVSGRNLAELAQVEPRDAIFDLNVRRSLGLGGQVNKNIYHSAIKPEHARDFWFKNNGITMVCDSFDVVRDPDNAFVRLKNLQIINGCQTTSALRAALEDGALSDEVKIQMKVYASKDDAFVNSVVIATNNQNSIGTRDLHANDEIQQLIQRKIADDFGLFYERARGEAKGQKIPKSNVIVMEKAGQAYLAMFKRQPTVSRAQKYKVFSPELYADIYEKSKPWQ